MSRRTRRIANKVMEYPDAPSGYVRLYNYKEPFIPFSKGYGYEGVLLMDGKGEKVQCHFCEKWFERLPMHIRLHNLNAKKYKSTVGLDDTSALISEKVRLAYIDRKPPQRIPWNDRPKWQQEKIKQKLRDAWKKGPTREKQNQRGTCPAQLIDWLRKLTEEKGRTPFAHEVASRRATLVRVFGSFENALRQARIKPRDRHELKTWICPDKDTIIHNGIEFYKVHKRVPVFSDFRRKLIAPSYKQVYYRFGSYKKFIKKLKQEIKTPR